MSSPTSETRQPTEWSAFKSVLAWNSNLHGKIIKGVVLLILAAISVMGSAYILGLMVDSIVSGISRKTWILAYSFLALESLAVLARYLGRLTMSGVTVETAYNIRKRLFSKMARVRIDYFDLEPYGRVLTRITSDVEGIEKFFGGPLVQLIISCLEIIFVIIAMLLTRPDLGLIITAACIPALLFSVMTRELSRKWLRIYRQRSASTNATLAELLNSKQIIRSFGLEKWGSSRLQEKTAAVLESGIKMMSINAIIRPLTVVLCFIPLVCVILVGADWISKGLISLGLVVTFIRYTERIINPVRNISHDIQFIQEALVAFMRVETMLCEEEEATPKSSVAYRGIADGPIAFKDVYLSYRNGPKVLNGISFSIEACTQTALVGKTGSGKSTIVKALSKLYPIQSGAITINGRTIDEWEQTTLREQIGYVSQDVVTFQGTIRDNLLAAVPDNLSDEEAINRLEGSGLSEWISSLPHGMDTRLTERGANLSSGQKQLIAIGRMLIRECRILILDEATASVDPDTEAALHKVVAGLKDRCTTILIAHRLSTVTDADQILVFDKGRIVEEGTHRSLLNENGYYHRLVSEQLNAHDD